MISPQAAKKAKELLDLGNKDKLTESEKVLAQEHANELLTGELSDKLPDVIEKIESKPLYESNQVKE